VRELVASLLVRARAQLSFKTPLEFCRRLEGFEPGADLILWHTIHMIRLLKHKNQPQGLVFMFEEA
jgi:hypothetical protein